MSDPISPDVSTESGTTTELNTPHSDKSDESDLRSDDQPIVSNAQITNHATASPETMQNVLGSDESDGSDLILDDQSIVSNVQATNCATPSPANLSRHQNYDIQRTRPKDINLKKIPASACWELDQTMENIFFFLHWAGQHSRALLKLSTKMCIKGVPNTPQNSLHPAFIYIYPKNIRQLSFTSQPECSHSSDPSLISLTFQLHKPPDLILPKKYAGFEHGAEDLMCPFRSLAQQSHFTIYSSISRRTLPASWWEQFCKDITGQKFETIETVADLRSLYNGSGGLIQEHDVLNQDDSLGLPAYQETDLSITLTRPTKRNKPCDESFTTTQSTDPERKKLCDESSMIRQTVQSADIITMQAFFEHINTELATHKNMIEKMVKDAKESMNTQLAAHKRSMEKLIEDTLSAHKHEFTKQLTGERETLEADLLYHIEEGVNKAIPGVVETIMVEISSMPVQAAFTFPNHPFL